jgi:hypothetical protein
VRQVKRPIYRSRWWMPAISLALGGLVLGAFLIAGKPGDGLAGLGVMAAIGAVFYFGRRNETLGGLGGPGRDERWEAIDTRANAAKGLMLIVVVLGAWLYEIADGRDGSPYGQLAAVAGVTYIVAVAVLRWRS